MARSYTVTKADYDQLASYATAGNFVEYYRKLEALGDRYATLAQGVDKADSFEGCE